MAIVTIRSSKATPVKALAYITDKGKAPLISAYQLDQGQDLARQMMETAKLWGKAQEEDDRKYYHLKISYDPKDWTRNGGPLTEREALQIGMQIMQEFCPGSESAGSVHTDKGHLHFHGVINAVDLQTGKMLDMRNADYRRLKDRVQEICAERGLTAIDWRKATKEKHAAEIQRGTPVHDTKAEQGLRSKGEVPWKDELREIIDDAACSCTSLDEFRAELAKSGVTLTRCTEQTISYKYGDHRACRGDTLGDDYTMAAILDALDHNQPAAPEQEHESLDAKIQRAGEAPAVPVSLEERQEYRQIGRIAGIPRADVDGLCDVAHRATWEEKQQSWEAYKAAKALFWDQYAIQQQAIKKATDKAYKLRKRAKAAEWALDPRNRRGTLAGVLYAVIVLSRTGSRQSLDREIQSLKRAQERLQLERNAFRADTKEALETLKKRDLPIEEYGAAVLQIQRAAEEMARANRYLTDREKEQLHRQAEREKARRQNKQKGRDDRGF